MKMLFNNLVRDRLSAQLFAMVLFFFCFFTTTGLTAADTAELSAPENYYQVDLADHHDTEGLVDGVDEDTELLDESVDTVPAEHFRELSPNFGPGEYKRWRVTYLGLTAGDLEAWVEEDEFEGRPAFRLNLRARSRGVASWLYRVRDQAVSFMDVGGLFSWGYEYFQDHKGEEDEERIRYYQDQGFFMDEEGKRGEIPPYTQDALSAVYYLRTLDLEVGDKASYPVQVGSDVGVIRLYVRRVEDVKTYDGWRKAYLVETELLTIEPGEDESGEIDKVDGIRIWLSKDERRVPYQIAVAAYFGSIYAYLEEYRPGEGY